MPVNYIAKVVDTCGITKADAEKLWDNAKDIVRKSYSRNEDDSLFYPLVMGTFKKSLGKECLDKLEVQAAIPVIAAKDEVVKPPSARVFPKGINPDATAIWKEVFKKQAKVIKEQPDALSKWAAAIVLYKRSCRKIGLAPFMGFVTKQKPGKGPILTELSAKIDPALRNIAKIEKLLTSKNILTKAQPKKFTLSQIKKEGKAKLLIAVKPLKFYRGVSPATVLATLLIPKFGFKKIKGNTYGVKVGAHTTLRIRYAKKSDNVAQLFVDLKILGKTWDNLSKEHKKPESHLKGWIRRGFLAQAATEVSDNIDLKEVYPIHTKEDVIHWLTTLTLPIIVNLGDEDFQLSLIDYLIANAKSFGVEAPQNLGKFKEDPEFRKATLIGYTFKPPSDKEDEGESLYSVEAPEVEPETTKELSL